MSKRKTKINNPHDRFFRDSFSMGDVAKEYLKGYFDPKIASKIDYDSLELAPTSYITPQLSEYFSDLVWYGRLKNGKPFRVGFLFEHKTFVPKVPYVQLLQYISSAYSIQLKNDEPLVLTVPIVVYHGVDKWEVKPFKDYFEGFDDDFLPYLPQFAYWFTHLDLIPDKILLELATSFLTKTFLALKHYKNPSFFRQEFHALIEFDLSDETFLEKSLVFFKPFLLYLSIVSDMTETEIVEIFEDIPEPLKEEAMSTYDFFVKKGMDKGIEKGIEIPVVNAFKRGNNAEQIADFMDLPLEKVKTIIENYVRSQNEN